VYRAGETNGVANGVVRESSADRTRLARP
jgi:hypothetical protein